MVAFWKKCFAAQCRSTTHKPSEKVLSLACGRQRNGDRVIKNGRRVRIVWSPMILSVWGFCCIHAHHHRGACIVARGMSQTAGIRNTASKLATLFIARTWNVFRPVSFAWRLPVSRTFGTQHSTHHSQGGRAHVRTANGGSQLKWCR